MTVDVNGNNPQLTSLDLILMLWDYVIDDLHNITQVTNLLISDEV
jgi:hypothetical protein